MGSIRSYRAWFIWLLSASFMFYKYALEVSPSVMTSTLMGSFHISATELGNLAATYFYAYLLLQIPAGLLLDKFGPRRVTTLAIALCALGSIVFAKADSFWVACVGRFLTGAGAAFGAVNCLKLISSWFPIRQFALMTGLMMSIAMLGAVGGQAPLSAFIGYMGNWRYSMEFIGLAGLVLAILFWFVVRDQQGGQVKVDARPTISPMASIKKILQSRQSWWLSAYSGLAFAPVMVFGGLWGVSFVTQACQVDSGHAASAVSLIFIGFAIGAPVFGWLSDWQGKRRPAMFLGTLLSLAAISIVVWAPSLSYGFLCILLFLFGFFISSFLLCFTMIKEINLPILGATAIGFMNAFDALFGAVSDPLAGRFLDFCWDGTIVDGARVFSLDAYKMAFVCLPVYLLISLFLMFRIKETYCKQEPATHVATS